MEQERNLFVLPIEAGLSHCSMFVCLPQLLACSKILFQLPSEHQQVAIMLRVNFPPLPFDSVKWYQSQTQCPAQYLEKLHLLPLPIPPCPLKQGNDATSSLAAKH